MSHIDKITGMRVSDMWEVLSDDEIKQLWENMEKDRVDTEKSIKEDKDGLYNKLRKYGNDFGINVVRVIDILDVKYSHIPGDSNTEIIAIIEAGDVEYKRTFKGHVQVNERQYGGSFYEPPDYDIDIGWLPLPKIRRRKVCKCEKNRVWIIG
jgi:hypothetical protein